MDSIEKPPIHPYSNIPPQRSANFLNLFPLSPDAGRFFSNNELSYPSEDITLSHNNFDNFSSTPVHNNPPIKQEISYISPIQSRRGFANFQMAVQSKDEYSLKNSKKNSISADDLEETPDFLKEVEFQKKPKKNVRLMLSSTPFESTSMVSDKSNEMKKNSYNLIDSIKEEPIEKSPMEKQVSLVLEENHSFHSVSSLKQPSKVKDLRLFVPLSNSFNLGDSNEDDDNDLHDLPNYNNPLMIMPNHVYPEKNDEILLKKLPKQHDQDIPEVISRTPSPVTDEKKHKASMERLKSFDFGEKTRKSPPSNEDMRRSIEMKPVEINEDENLLHLLPMDEEGKDIDKDSKDESPYNIDEKDSTDSEYDNYHKLFDNPFLIQDKKSNEEEKKSAGSNNVLNESSIDSQKYSIPNSFNSKAKTDHDIVYENHSKLSKQQTVLQKIELDIQKNADSNYKNTIKNIDNLINVERNDHKHISLPPNFMTNSWGNNNYSESSNTLTPLNFLNMSQQQPAFYASPSPSSHFDRFVFNESENLIMTNSSSFPGFY